MEKIERKDIKVGSFVYIEYKEFTKRRYVLEILGNVGEELEVFWCRLTQKKNDFFGIWNNPRREIPYGTIVMIESWWGLYNIFELNKQEVIRFKKMLILEKLRSC